MTQMDLRYLQAKAAGPLGMGRSPSRLIFGFSRGVACVHQSDGRLVWRETTVSGQVEFPSLGHLLGSCPRADSSRLGLEFRTQKLRDLDVGWETQSHGVDDAHHPSCCWTLLLRRVKGKLEAPEEVDSCKVGRPTVWGRGHAPRPGCVCAVADQRLQAGAGTQRWEHRRQECCLTAPSAHDLPARG